MKFFEALAHVMAGDRITRHSEDEPRYLWIDDDGRPRDCENVDDDGYCGYDWMIEKADLEATDWEVQAPVATTGSFAWALDQLQHGKVVRRSVWAAHQGYWRMNHHNALVVRGGLAVGAPELARMALYNDWEVIE